MNAKFISFPTLLIFRRDSLCVHWNNDWRKQLAAEYPVIVLHSLCAYNLQKMFSILCSAETFWQFHTVRFEQASKRPRTPSVSFQLPSAHPTAMNLRKYMKFQIFPVFGTIIVKGSGTAFVRAICCCSGKENFRHILIWRALRPRFHATSGLRRKCVFLSHKFDIRSDLSPHQPSAFLFDWNC